MCFYHRSVLDLDSEPFVGGVGDRCANLEKAATTLMYKGLMDECGFALPSLECI